MNETLKWCHKVNQTHSPVLSSLGHKNARLPYFKKVQHPNEKSWAKKRFRQRNQGSSKSLFMWKKFLGEWHFKLRWPMISAISCDHFQPPAIVAPGNSMERFSMFPIGFWAFVSGDYQSFLFEWYSFFQRQGGSLSYFDGVKQLGPQFELPTQPCIVHWVVNMDTKAKTLHLLHSYLVLNHPLTFTAAGLSGIYFTT